MTDCPSIQSMMPYYLIPSEKQGKITGPSHIGHSDLQKHEVTCSVKPNKYPKYDAYLSDIANDIR